MNIQPPRIGPQPWEIVRTKLDRSADIFPWDPI